MGFWIRDFQVFETEVQIIMDLIGRRRKISFTISSGKYSHGDRSIKLLLMLSDIFGASVLQRKRKKLRGYGLGFSGLKVN